jgi:hypothetical protein
LIRIHARGRLLLQPSPIPAREAYSHDVERASASGGIGLLGVAAMPLRHRRLRRSLLFYSPQKSLEEANWDLH